MKLAGLTVLDLSSFLPGPYLTLSLADHGARVVKIEAPGGDHGRAIGPGDDIDTVFFRNLNRGKHSIVLNLKDPADKARFLDMAGQADIIVESSRPGVARRLGIDYDTVRRINPGIIYCAITAFGQDGPLAQRPAHDLAIEAMTGLLSTNLGPDGQIALPAIPIADVVAGLQGLAAILMALHERQQIGLGDYIDISMQEALLASTLNILGPTLTQGVQPSVGEQRTTGGAAFYAIYDTADGRQIALAGQESKFVHALLTHLGRLDLAPLCDQPGAHQAPVKALLTETFGAMPLAAIDALLTRLDLCWGPVNSLPEALDDAQVSARGFILRDQKGRRHIGPPIRFSRSPAHPVLHAPALNEHGSLPEPFPTESR